MEIGEGPAPPVDPIAMLRDALEWMPHGVSAWSLDHRLLYWNRAYLRLYDIAPDQIREGMTLRERCAFSLLGDNHPGIALDILHERHLRRLTANSDPGRPAVHLDQVGERFIERTYLVSPGLGWVVIHADETARVRREQELKAEHSRLDLALDSMDYGFCLFDAGFRLLVWNDRFVSLYRLAAEDVVAGMDFKDVLRASVAVGNHLGRSAAEMVARERARLALVPPGDSIHSEATLADGRAIRIRWRRTHVGWWVVTHEDITEQRDRIEALRRREAELAVQNTRFKAAVDHMTQGLCMFDAHHELIICNQGYARLYRLSPALALPGARLSDIWRHIGFRPPGGPEAYMKARIESLARGELAETIELDDGRIISVIHRALPEGGWVATHEDVTAQRRSEARIRYLARHDELTGLPNRTLFRERMQEAEERLALGEAFGVLFVDLDRFKTVNDLYGHATGDTVLRQVAQRLLASCRDTDVVARLGGDEFAVLQLSLSAPQDAAALAERLVHTVAAPLQASGSELVLGASIGIAVAPDDGGDVETLMKHADLAAYRAKAEGRGAYHFFEPGMDAALQERRAFESDLRGAVARNELALAFQPLVRLSDQRVASAEALLRWRHPERGLVMPDRVIAAAERSGLIAPIGEWVLREACRAAADWPGGVSVAVNVSPLQFAQRNVLRHVEAALAESGLDPARLAIEVTETALLADDAATLAALDALRRLGVRLSLDDFGIGYSSLGYLRTFPFDKIKIDRSFVGDLAAPGHGAAIARTMIALGRDLGMTTTAEGVETAAQLAFVREEGCDEVQGDYISPPLAPEAIARLLERQAEGAVGGAAWSLAS